ncbi:hypothetical protein [Ancylomarina sp.]|uniref:hypothetical protein n=1 Tax=Ancylomarina sp. TaxID=1970196 RepID=UPI00356B4B70
MKNAKPEDRNRFEFKIIRTKEIPIQVDKVYKILEQEELNSLKNDENYVLEQIKEEWLKLQSDEERRFIKVIWDVI